MAIVRETGTVKMITQLNFGMVDGKELIKKKSYSNVRETVTDEVIYQIAEMIGNVQVPAMETVVRSENGLLYDDGL